MNEASMNTVRWENPYGKCEGLWLKGNLHTHTKEGSPCGTLPVRDVLILYEEEGYDFLALSDHLKILPEPEGSILLIPGVEWNARAESFPEDAVVPEKHIGFYSLERGSLLPMMQERTVRGVLDTRKKASPTLSILNHPNWGLVPHWPTEEMESLFNLVDGIEIYNGVIHRLEGSPFAVDQWDLMLSRGYRFLGFASDDFHWATDFGKGWIMARVLEKSASAIVNALKRGAFYCSTGVVFLDLHREGDTVTVVTKEPALIRGIGRFQKILYEIVGTKASFRLEGTAEDYLRIEATGEDSAKAWTQPFFKGT